MDIKSTHRKIFCKDNYIGLILRSNTVHENDDEITGDSHGLRLNLLKTDYIIGVDPFTQSHPMSFEITDYMVDGSKKITTISDVYLIANHYHLIDHYMVFDFVEWVAESISVIHA